MNKAELIEAMASSSNLTKALGIKTTHNDLDLQGDQLWVEDLGLKILKNKIEVGPRIGVGYAGNDALLPYRFVLKQ